MSEKKSIEVLSTVYLSEAHQAQIKAVNKLIHLTTFNNRDSSEIPKEQWEKVEVLLSSGQFLPTSEQAPDLRWIQITYAGIEQALNFPIAHEKQVLITSASGIRVSQMGEYILMALLALGHRLPETIQLQREKKWPNNVIRTMVPRELRDSTVGIVGYGSIGREVARLLYTFGAKVLAAKKNVMLLEDRGYNAQGLGDPHGNYFHRLYPIEGLTGMLKECDFVVLTLPLTKDTKHILSTEAFDAMKPGTGLVNTGRGGLIDEVAMEAALRSGKLSGAVLDVFEQEPLPENSSFWTMPNVIVTPHLSGLSGELMDAVIELFCKNLAHFIAGDPLLNLVDPQQGY